jgi:hypothetical protein
MANEIQEIEVRASRINHPVYRDVYNTTFDRDIIEDFEMSFSGELSGMCQTAEYGWLPVFYHCKRHCYTEYVAGLESNDSLNGGVMAFEVDHEVKVLLEKEKPKFVIDHFEQHNPPYMCADLIKLHYATYQKEEHHLFYSASNGAEWGGLDSDGVWDCGVVPKMDVPEKILFGLREFVSGTVNYYWTDRFVKVGPVCYIIRIKSTCLPGVITFPFEVLKAVWTEDDPVPTPPVYPDQFVHIVAFEETLRKRFVDPGMIGGVRWIYTHIYGQSYEI